MGLLAVWLLGMFLCVRVDVFVGVLLGCGVRWLVDLFGSLFVCLFECLLVCYFVGASVSFSFLFI